MSVFKFKSRVVLSRATGFPTDACMVAASITLFQFASYLYSLPRKSQSQQSRATRYLSHALTMREDSYAAA